MIELYINDVLVNTSKDFTVRLNRQILNPAELNTKDSKFTYSISLPLTPTNSLAFGFADVEEVSGKFTKEYKARLYVDSVEIIDGLFRLSEVNNRGFKGNLYKPAQRSVKDVLADAKLVDTKELRIPFADFAESISRVNRLALVEPQPAIFPFVLYGLLPKVPLNKDANNFTPRTVWDDTVRVGMQDIPPSFNVMLLIRHLFNSNGLRIGGDAFSDKRLANLYMSFKNPSEFAQPWNYGHHGHIKLWGEWRSRYNMRNGREHLETGVNQPSSNIYSVNLMDATNTAIHVQTDTGGNVLYKEVRDASGNEWAQTQIRVPATGFYKVKFNASARVVDSNNWRATEPVTGIQHVSGESSKRDNRLHRLALEVKLLRDRKNADFGLQRAKIDGVLYYDNLPQNTTYDVENSPKLIPSVNANGQIIFVDTVQNKNIVLGLSLGSNNDDVNMRNPLSPYLRSAVLTAKPALSWDTREVDTPFTPLAIKADGYMKYGRIGDFDKEGDNPDIDLDYSGGDIREGIVLDSSGNPQTVQSGEITARTDGYINTALMYNIDRDPDYEALPMLLRTSDYLSLKVSAVVKPKNMLAVVGFYGDINIPNSVFPDSGILAPAESTEEGEEVEDLVLDNLELVGYKPYTSYVRVSNAKAQGFTVTAVPKSNDNVVLVKFPLQKYYTYKIMTSSSYDKTIFIHATGASNYGINVEVINGYAEFSIPSHFENPTITAYLKSETFDVRDNFRIDRTIEAGSEDVIGWERTDRYHIELNGAPTNFARTGQFNNAPINELWGGQGSANAVVWLEAGELLSVGAVSTEGGYRRSGMHSTFGIVDQHVIFDLELEPYRVDRDWLKVSLTGVGTGVMRWDDRPNFDTDSINVYGFLPEDIKANDFIDNVVKALNLKLLADGDGGFTLSVKQSKAVNSSLFVDLDGKASVINRTNTPLGLPSEYKIGFTINEDEEGYAEHKTDGGGSFQTGATDGQVVEQKSFFSYNWFKDLQKDGATLRVPNISKSEAWKLTTPYPEAMGKRYTDLNLRLWYMDGLINSTFMFNGKRMELAQISNQFEGFDLSYYNKPRTLLTEYYTLLINSSGHYSELGVYLTVSEYESLNGSKYARFNGDMYLVAQLEGYDPTQVNKTKIKLIRVL